MKMGLTGITHIAMGALEGSIEGGEMAVPPAVGVDEHAVARRWNGFERSQFR